MCIRYRDVLKASALGLQALLEMSCANSDCEEQLTWMHEQLTLVCACVRERERERESERERQRERERDRQKDREKK